MPVQLTLPPDPAALAKLTIGTKVLLSGTLYTARDAAHKKMITALKHGESLPFNISGQVLYYVGPTPASPPRPIGAAGPTTSGRMDIYTPTLLQAGLAAMIGKGQRSPQVIEAIRAHGAVYFAAVGGTGALLAEKIIKSQIIAFHELGPEAIHRLDIEGFPAVVAVDCHGNDLYDSGRRAYRRKSESGTQV